MPRVDGVFLTDEPFKLVQEGKVAPIPYVSGEPSSRGLISFARLTFVGNVDDEGTLFSLPLLNVTYVRSATRPCASLIFADRTTNEFKGWVRNFWPDIPQSQVDQVAEAYPSDITKGSPFDTGILNAISPQFKRISAFQGDGVFHGPRRFLLEHTSHKQNTWAYRASQRLPARSS